MARPVVSRFAEDTYKRLGPAADAIGGDELRGWHLLHFTYALALMFKRVEDLVRSNDGSPPWRNAVDVNTAATQDLPFVGQLFGSRPIAGDTDAQARTRIRSVSGFKRGTTAAQLAAVQAVLTGTKYVALVERAGGNAYALQVSTRAAETPDVALATARSIAAKPAGLTLTFVATASVTWGEMEIRNSAATWLAVEAQFATYADAEAVV
jgi:hypothetical protein